MYTKNLKAIFISVFSMLMFASCNNSSKEPENNQESIIDTTPVSEEPKEESSSYILPSPLQIAAIFKKSGLVYISGLTNQQKEASKYTSAYSKAINMGVYTSDLAYSVLNKKNQEAINYMKLARQLGSELGMASVFEANNLSDRFEKNISREDSLAQIISELQMETDMYLEENEQEHVSVLAFAGAWVESMYIGSKVFEQNKTNISIKSKIAEQMTILSKIIRVLESRKDNDSNIPTLISDLKSINELYELFPQVKRNLELEAAGKDTNIVQLEDEEFKQLSDKIAELRTKIINN